MRVISTVLFYGLNNWSLYFLLIFIFHLIFLIIIRGVLPRIRYDILIKAC